MNEDAVEKLMTFLKSDEELYRSFARHGSIKDVISSKDYQQLLAGKCCTLWVKMPDGTPVCVEWEDC